MMIIFLLYLLLLFTSINSQTDSTLVKCTVPSQLLTDEVFTIKIELENTGTTTWGQGNVEVILISKNPDFNENWGPWLIIQGQGTQVKPGETKVFSSPARAPSKPGNYQSSWQLQNWIPSSGSVPSNLESIPFLGKIVTCPSVQVIQRTETEPKKVYKKGVINVNDFVYKGSFRLPSIGQEAIYSNSGLTMKIENGEKHLLLFAGTYDSYLYETKIPKLEILTNSSTDHLKRAELVRQYGELRLTWTGEKVVANGGMYYDQSTNLLYWIHSNGYYTGKPSKWPQLIASRLNSNGTTTDVSYWHLSDQLSKFKGYWGGITPLSDRFANKYTNGKNFGLGFGGYYSICGTASRGPAIGAIELPKETTTGVLDLTPMLNYDDPHACNRDGTYFSNIYWGSKPENPWTGKWTGIDKSRSGVYIDGDNKKGFVFFAYQAINRVGYDYGGYNTGGKYKHVWIFYDESDIGNITMPYNEKQPTSFSDFDYPIKPWSLATGSYYDPDTKLLYIFFKSTKNMKGKKENLVHVYEFTDLPDSDNSIEEINPFSIVISVVISISIGVLLFCIFLVSFFFIFYFGFLKKNLKNKEIELENEVTKA